MGAAAGRSWTVGLGLHALVVLAGVSCGKVEHPKGDPNASPIGDWHPTNGTTPPFGPVTSQLLGEFHGPPVQSLAVQLNLEGFDKKDQAGDAAGAASVLEQACTQLGQDVRNTPKHDKCLALLAQYRSDRGLGAPAASAASSSAPPAAPPGSTTAAAPAASTRPDVAERLKKLDALHQMKAISDDEYAAQRKRILQEGL